MQEQVWQMRSCHKYTTCSKCLDWIKTKLWRACYIVPGVLLWIVGLGLYFFSDDCPAGNYKELIASSQRKKVPFLTALKRASSNYVVWLLFITYAISFGVEVLLNIKLSSYFQSRYSVTQSNAGLAAGLFGLMNIFARTLGGVCSDMSGKYFGMRGRLWSLFIFLLLEGVFCLIFYEMSSFGASIGVLVPFSIFVQCSTGSVFSIVPFVLPNYVGGVAGVVGAGGNVGSVVFGFLWKLPGVSNDPGKPFFFLSFFIIGLAFVVPLIYFPKYGAMFLKPRSKEPLQQNNDTTSWIPMKVDEQVECLSKGCVEVLNDAFAFEWQFLRCMECNKKNENICSGESKLTHSEFEDEVRDSKPLYKIAIYLLKLEIVRQQRTIHAMIEVDLFSNQSWTLRNFSIPLDLTLSTTANTPQVEE